MGNTIKHLNASLILLMTLSFLSFATACSSDKPEQEVVAKVVIAQPEMTFSKTGGTEDLYTQSNVTLDVKSSDESWCRVAPASTASTFLGSVHRKHNDMYAIVNIHWDGGWLENNVTPDKQDAVNNGWGDYEVPGSDRNATSGDETEMTGGAQSIAQAIRPNSNP